MVGTKKIRRLIEEATEKIKTGYEPDKIILYGSYAYGKPNRHSDVDLFIIKETSKDPIQRSVEVRKLIYSSERRISISPMVYTPAEVDERLRLGDDFVAEILDRGEVLYAR